jgi:hypothetical protein
VEASFAFVVCSACLSRALASGVLGPILIHVISDRNRTRDLLGLEISGSIGKLAAVVFDFQVGDVNQKDVMSRMIDSSYGLPQG